MICNIGSPNAHVDNDCSAVKRGADENNIPDRSTIR
jgi:hypothetical protein